MLRVCCLRPSQFFLAIGLAIQWAAMFPVLLKKIPFVARMSLFCQNRVHHSFTINPSSKLSIPSLMTLFPLALPIENEGHVAERESASPARPINPFHSRFRFHSSDFALSNLFSVGLLP
jgi:hypothetical protein